ncbi:MAG: metallopeptidase family protein [Acidimicrobiia bacterium]|nr:MAG: metallopeptidase family protein [Acidimicrobiia bacterium]
MNVEAFEAEVESIVEALPPHIRSQLDNVTVEVAFRQPADMNEPLLGLYEGVPLPERGIDYFAVAPDRIRIFYAQHQALELSDADLRTEIRRTVLHEIGHHLGISDARLKELGWD